MKIKLAIVDPDQNYINRINATFTNHYASKLEVYSFSDFKVALDTIKKEKIQVLLASESYEVQAADLPGGCGFAYFVESPDVQTYNEQRAICKFQRADLIYREILAVFSAHVSENMGMRQTGDASGAILTFASPAGGTGSSSMAAACAKYLAQIGKQVIYINLEEFGETNGFFTSTRNFDFSDVIFTLKSKSANMALKLESCVDQDVSGVFYFPACKTPLHMQELSVADIETLLSEIRAIGVYEYIVLDAHMSLSAICLAVLKQSRRIVMVSDGSIIANQKINRAYKAIGVLEEQMEAALTSRIGVLYNQFSSENAHKTENTAIPELGGAPRCKNGTTMQIVNYIASLKIFHKLLE